MGVNRLGHGFRFPKDAFAEKIALYENFRYLENYLQFLGRGDKYGTTVIVATESSENKERAHYIVDGTADEEELQSAFDDVEQEGGEVVLLEGTYNISAGDSLVVPSQNITLRGAGAVLNFADIGFESGLSLGVAEGATVAEKRITVHGIHFTGGGDDARIVECRNGHILIFGCYFNDLTCCHAVGATALNATVNVIVANNHFTNITLKNQTVNAVCRFGASNQAQHAVIGNNLFQNIQDDAVFGTYIAYAQGGASGALGIATGNNILGSSGLTGYFTNINASHNSVDGVMLAGTHSLALTDLSDVGDGDPTNGDILVADGDSWEATPGAEWVSDQVGAMLTGNTETNIAVTYQDADNTIDFVVALDLDDLGDVVITTPSDGEVLTYDSGSGDWINDTGGGGASTLDDLTDVVITTPADGDVLTYDVGSGDWINTPLVALDIGEWEAWTPSLTNLNIGSTGTQVARYTQFGSTVFFYYHATLGGTGISVGDVQVSVPVAEHANYSSGTDDRWAVGVATIIDASTQSYDGITTIDDGNLRPRVLITSGTNATQTNLSSTVPFTFAAADRIIIQGFYEAADSVPVEGIVVPGSLDLDDLGDVVITGVADGEVLTYDSGSGDWVNAAAAGGSGSPLFWKAASPGSYDDYFDSDNSSDWTAVAPDSGTIAWNYNYRADLGPTNRGWHVRYDDQSQGDFGAQLKSVSGITTGDYIQCSMQGNMSNNFVHNYKWQGLAFTNGTTSSAACISIDIMSDNSGFHKIMGTSGTLTAHQDLHVNTYVEYWLPQLHMRLVYSAANTWQCWISLNGEQFFQMGSDISYTLTPTHAGFIAGTWGGSTQVDGTFGYFHSNVTP